jgi:hypothetical protein
MTLAAGAKLGPYEILAPIGAGSGLGGVSVRQKFSHFDSMIS